MSQIKLIALDMDGTLLNSKLNLSSENIRAIHNAARCENNIILCSGRAINEVEQYTKELPDIRYMIGESGAVMYDFQQKKLLEQITIPQSIVLKIVEIYKKVDAFLLVCINGMSTVETSQLAKLDYYHLKTYSDLYYNHAIHTENIVEAISHHLNEIEKMNLYFADTKDLLLAQKQLESLNIECIRAGEYVLENNAQAISKAKGLKHLCDLLKIELKDCMAIGDSDNDLEVLKIVGTPVAVENANDHIKEVAQYIVSSNDNDGVSEALRNLL